MRWTCKTGNGGFERRRLPLAAIYVLADRSNDRDARIEKLSGRASVLALVANSYTGYLLDPAMRAEELSFLTRLAAQRSDPAARPGRGRGSAAAAL